MVARAHEESWCWKCLLVSSSAMSMAQNSCSGSEQLVMVCSRSWLVSTEVWVY
jgi:hypothetical protein